MTRFANCLLSFYNFHCIRLLLSWLSWLIQGTVCSHHGLWVPHRRFMQIRDTSTAFATLSLTHRAGSGDLDWSVSDCGGFLERGEEGLDRLGRKVLVIVVVDLDHGRVDTGTQTLDFNEGEEAVFRGVARGDTQVFRNGFDDLGATAATELAWCLNNGNFPVSN